MPVPPLTVDEFVKTRVKPELRPVVEMLRGLMRETAPKADEVIAWGIPMYKAGKYIVVISPTKRDVTFVFTHGTEFEDRFGLLRGKGKVSRHIKLKTVDSVGRAALRYYIRQAVRRDREAARAR